MIEAAVDAFAADPCLIFSAVVYFFFWFRRQGASIVDPSPGTLATTDNGGPIATTPTEVPQRLRALCPDHTTIVVNDHPAFG
jgi:hypothetical protein